MRLCALIFLRNFFLLLGCQNHTTVLHIPSSLQNVLEVYTRCMRCSSNMNDSQPVCIDSNVFTKGFLLHPSPVSQGISEYFVKFCFAMFCPICLWFWQCGPVMPMHGAVRTSWIFTLCLNPLRSFAGGFSTTSLLISLFLFLCNSRHLGSRFANMHSCGPCSARNKPGYGGFIVWNLQDLLTKSCSFKKECFLYWKRWHPGLLRGWPMRQPITLWQGSGPLED